MLNVSYTRQATFATGVLHKIILAVMSNCPNGSFGTECHSSNCIGFHDSMNMVMMPVNPERNGE